MYMYLHTYTWAGIIATIVSLCNLGQRLWVLCWPTDVDLIVVHLNLEARGEKRVEPYN